MSRLGGAKRSLLYSLLSWLSGVTRFVWLFLAGNPDGVVSCAAETDGVSEDLSETGDNRMLARRLAAVSKLNRRIISQPGPHIETYRQDRARIVRSAVMRRQLAAPMMAPLSSRISKQGREGALVRPRVISVDFRRSMTRPTSRSHSRPVSRLARAA